MGTGQNKCSVTTSDMCNGNGKLLQLACVRLHPPPGENVTATGTGSTDTSPCQ